MKEDWDLQHHLDECQCKRCRESIGNVLNKGLNQ